MSGHGTSFFEGKKWKNIMKYMYGLGAAVVIVGALFKIQHWPFASEMLILGLGTEALIFAMTVFEPVHLDTDWSRVFPELADTEGEGVDGVEGVGLYDLIKPGGADGVAIQMREAGIDDNLLRKLKDGMSNFADNASSLGSMASATGATGQYVTSLKNASSSLDNLAEQYKESATSIAAISGEGNNFGPEMERLSSNIAALNSTYELQLKSSQDYIASSGQLKELQESIKSVMSDLAASAGDTQIYRENMATLSQNLGDLNNVYGNMLKAMKSNL